MLELLRTVRYRNNHFAKGNIGALTLDYDARQLKPVVGLPIFGDVIKNRNQVTTDNEIYTE